MHFSPHRKTHRLTEASVRYPSGGGMHFDRTASRLTCSLVFDVNLCTYSTSVSVPGETGELGFSPNMSVASMNRFSWTLKSVCNQIRWP